MRNLTDYPFEWQGGNRDRNRKDQETSFSPANGVIPIVYGRRKIKGLPIYINVIAGALHVIYLLCEGEIEEIESIEINGKPPSDYGIYLYYECYIGSMTQDVCALKNYDSRWEDRLAGTAYIYMRISARNEEITDLPSLNAVVKGLKVYNPVSETYIYSTNPVLHLVDLLTNNRYGARIPSEKINWDSVIAAMNYCDYILTGTEGQQRKRYEFNYYFESEMDIETAINTISKHFIGTVLFSNEKYYIEYARPKNKVADFVESEVMKVSLKRPNVDETFNRVVCTWTNEKWETEEVQLEHPDIVINGEEVREAKFDLTGCLTLAQARSIAHYLLNSNINDLYVDFITYDDKGLQPTDIFSLTHSIGLTNKLFMCITVEFQNDGSSRISGKEYDPGVFNDVIMTEPTFPDTELPHPLDIPTDVSNLRLEENVMQLKDKTWITKIKAEWSESEFPFIKHYEVWIQQGSEAFKLLGTTTSTDYQTPTITELQEYTIKIITVSTYGKKSAGITGQIIPIGKYAAPIWKDGATLDITEAGGIVFLRWSMPDYTPPTIDLDIVGYELRRGLTTDTWNTALHIAFIDALDYVDYTAPSTECKYFLKAKDSVGNYTNQALTASIQVTKNPNLGFQENQNFNLEGATVTNVNIEKVLVDGLFKDWAYPSNSLLWGQRFDITKVWSDTLQPYPLSTYPKWNQPAPIDPTTMTLISEAIDLGAIISGRWTLNFHSQLIDSGAMITRKLLLSVDGIDYIEYDASTMFSASARYVKVKFIFQSSSDKSYYIVKYPYINIAMTPKSDMGEASVPAGTSQPLNITFNISFNFLENLLLTPIGNTALNPIADNLTLSGFDLYLFDHNNNKVAGTVKWKAEGY